MKILMGNNTLDWLAGSETFTYTLAKAFKSLGHEVTGFSPQLGFIAMQLEKEGIKCVSDFPKKGEVYKYALPLAEEADEDFDVIICNHYEITRYLHARFPAVPIIATVHGILHMDMQTKAILPEHPVTDFAVGQYVAVSEEVQGLLKQVYNLESVVIRNSFDLEKFEWVKPEMEQDKPILAVKEPKMFLINSNYTNADDPQVAVLREVVKHYDAKFKAVGANFAGSWDMQEVIRDCDVVVGMGRSVLEGFCMGKISLVHGRWGTGGVLTPGTYDTLKLTNFSGRSHIEGQMVPLASAEEIIAMIEEARNPERIDWQKKVAAEEHNSMKAAARYLEIAERLIHENNRPDQN